MESRQGTHPIIPSLEGSEPGLSLNDYFAGHGAGFVAGSGRFFEMGKWSMGDG